MKNLLIGAIFLCFLSYDGLANEVNPLEEAKRAAEESRALAEKARADYYKRTKLRKEIEKEVIREEIIAEHKERKEQKEKALIAAAEANKAKKEYEAKGNSFLSKLKKYYSISIIIGIALGLWWYFKEKKEDEPKDKIRNNPTPTKTSIS